MPSLSTILKATRARFTIPPDEVFQSVAGAVEEHMATYDASHDFEHVLRVTGLSQSILAEESGTYDATVVILAALEHRPFDQKSRWLITYF